MTHFKATGLPTFEGVVGIRKLKTPSHTVVYFLRRLCRLFFGLTSNIPKQSNYVSSGPADTNKTFHHGALLAFLPILQRVSRTNPLAESLI